MMSPKRFFAHVITPFFPPQNPSKPIPLSTVVKDICIDDGVPSQEKILFEKTLCIFLPAEKDRNKELVKEKEDIDTSIPDASQGFDDNRRRLP
uniref:Uncharacterized protein n=1 Tax=Quercus lobata TaxID=97700 RepID=A0A7N2MIC7_QUELO